MGDDTMSFVRIKDHTCSKDSIRFGFQNPPDEDTLKALQKIVNEHKDVCSLVQSSSSVCVGIKIFNVSDESKFETAVKALSDTILIENYLRKTLIPGRGFPLHADVKSSDSDDEEGNAKYEMLNRILRMFQAPIVNRKQERVLKDRQKISLKSREKGRGK